MLNTFCPGRGSNQNLLRGSQTLYRVAIKAGLYRKAVQVCIIPNITTHVSGNTEILGFYKVHLFFYRVQNSFWFSNWYSRDCEEPF